MEKNIVPARPAVNRDTRKRPFRQKLKKTDASEAHVVVPEDVNLPLPKPPGQQISVPASINGRDLTDGRP